jgi:hypothetical protein
MIPHLACFQYNEDVYSGDLNHLFGLLSQSLQSLVIKVNKSEVYQHEFLVSKKTFQFIWFLWKKLSLRGKTNVKWI